MSNRGIVVAAALAAVLGLAPASDAQAGKKRIVDRSSVELAGDSGAEGALRMKVVRRRSGELAKGSLRVAANGLAPRERFRLLMDDPTDARGPALLLVAEARSNRHGRLRVRFAKRDLPFGIDPARLEGARVELRDDSGATVLSAAMPALESRAPAAVHVAGEEHGCPYRDVVLEEDDFSDGTAGSAPAGWTITGTDATAGRTILVDDSVDDGDEGLTVAITDTDSTNTTGPAMILPFTSQTGRVAAEYTLIPANGASRVVAQLGTFDGTTFTAAAALADGAGLHEDGQVGLGGVADFGAYTAGTAVTFRIDADVASDTFDLTIDGVVVATGVTLGMSSSSLTALDALRITTGDDVTGTANLDAVRVLDVEEDCPPIADAGDDLTIECAGTRTPVTLDGTGSSDPEGEDLTYAWTGRFAEGTATGATPTVTLTALGTYTISLVVNDGVQDSAADTVDVTLEDTTPPRIAAPDDVTMECTGPGTQVRLGTPTVFDICDPDPAVTNDAPRAYRLGDTTVTWTATDASGNSASDTQTVTIVDTTPPTLRVGGLPDELWPANHRMVDIRPRIAVNDICDPDPQVTVRVVSSEPDDSQTGDGNTTGDIVIHSAYHIELRAERKGNGSGRTYTLVWTATDRSGNSTSTRPMTISVPHDQGNGGGGDDDDRDDDDRDDDDDDDRGNNGRGNNGKAKGKKKNK